ncbi:long-chain fatty acid--CoA ligase [Siccirubricoccus sp. KC 17139]|uniref:Long-chain fatty acid--CoA ligase n=1 Tax=Siccirubricoccus soli TaxID=2899147 RepID=A0ABT1D6W7_9PROT|nr:long-chain fatty acid--CoA ligase [Siccirubricoccus soli]MCO6417667.1 long-chain fatty acid--CoA ligase [Siccirubricoccus soli]MCP2683802.1 long-chain fatty acid--CoA ligase [Siccirubricoccus soli]
MPDTLPKLLVRNARGHGGEVAYREKEYGIWRSLTWAEAETRTRAIALGLRSLGLGAGDVVGLIGDNRPDWVMGEIAAHAIGARSLGIYRDALEDEVAYLLGFSGAKAVIAEDEEQVDKLLGLGERAPSLSHIIYCDPRGMRKYADPRLLPLSELLACGEAAHAAEPGAWETMVAATQGEEVAILCTTSGTTARPKLAMLTGGALIRHCEAYLRADPKSSADEYVSVLPLPWIMEQIYVLGWGLIARMKVSFVEEPETMMADFREIGPSFVLFAPRVWEAIAAEVRAKVMDASPLKRRLYDLGMEWGLAALAKGRRSARADALLFRALRDRLGFTNLRSAATGGAALGPDTFRFFQAMGVPLRQIYGQTETLGAYTVHRPDDVDQDTVGIAFTDEIETRIDNPDQNGLGEIVTRHPNMFSGYFGLEDSADLRDGWLHTGDAGYVDARGHLVVIDRIKDIATTSTGDRFSPQYIENKLKFSPYVAEAVVLGDGRSHLAAMICIRFPIVSKWAERNRIAFTTYTDLSAREQVLELLRAEVEKVNAALPPAQRIRDFLLLYKELDADDEELTRTRKIRRGVINAKYGDIIEAVYRGESAIPVDTTIAFQDGTKQRIRTTLKVVSLRDPMAMAASRAPARAEVE